MNLKVPFAEKDAAKKLGARWDAARKLWYVEGDGDMAAFARWSPTPHDAAVAPLATPLKKAPARSEASGKVYVGSAYVELTRICACLPWEVCEQCRAMALNHG